VKVPASQPDRGIAATRKSERHEFDHETAACRRGMERRINVGMPDDLHRALRMYCAQHRLTMRQVIVELLKRLLLGGEKPPA
jgi:hypothetical protein